VEDSRARGEPLIFRLGDQGQVVEGLDAGIRRMRRGGRAMLVVPSHLAFGHKGSAGGIVPPFTTMIYEVEVLRTEAVAEGTDAGS
jgi:FKBP-type peptidyl-prolyl cis-trans isomerase